MSKLLDQVSILRNKSTHHPTNKKPHSKKYQELKSPEYGDEITRRAKD